MAVLCHWITAVTVIGLFALGLWMTSLNYYDPWYQTAPDIHRSVGILLAMLVAWRLVWKFTGQQPATIPTHRPWERVIAKSTHGLLYVLLLLMFVSGYLITTAEGSALHVFNWFSIPAVTTGSDLDIKNLEDRAGDVHEILAYTIIGLATLHALAALKHHFIDKDITLLRMLGKAPGQEDG